MGTAEIQESLAGPAATAGTRVVVRSAGTGPERAVARAFSSGDLVGKQLSLMHDGEDLNDVSRVWLAIEDSRAFRTAIYSVAREISNRESGESAQQ
jgi:hypothetical protein